MIVINLSFLMNQPQMSVLVIESMVGLLKDWPVSIGVQLRGLRSGVSFQLLLTMAILIGLPFKVLLLQSFF